MSSTTRIFSLNQLIDIALKIPETGTVNFRVLRIVLKIIVKELFIDDMYARIFVKDLQIPASLMEDKVLDDHLQKHGLAPNEEKANMKDDGIKRPGMQPTVMGTDEEKRNSRVDAEEIVMFDQEYIDRRPTFPFEEEFYIQHSPFKREHPSRRLEREFYPNMSYDRDYQLKEQETAVLTEKEGRSFSLIDSSYVGPLPISTNNIQIAIQENECDDNKSQQKMIEPFEEEAIKSKKDDHILTTSEVQNESLVIEDAIIIPPIRKQSAFYDDLKRPKEVGSSSQMGSDEDERLIERYRRASSRTSIGSTKRENQIITEKWPGSQTWKSVILTHRVDDLAALLDKAIQDIKILNEKIGEETPLKEIDGGPVTLYSRLKDVVYRKEFLENIKHVGERLDNMDARISEIAVNMESLFKGEDETPSNRDGPQLISQEIIGIIPEDFSLQLESNAAATKNKETKEDEGSIFYQGETREGDLIREEASPGPIMYEREVATAERVTLYQREVQEEDIEEVPAPSRHLIHEMETAKDDIVEIRVPRSDQGQVRQADTTKGVTDAESTICQKQTDTTDSTMSQREVEHVTREEKTPSSQPNMYQREMEDIDTRRRVTVSGGPIYESLSNRKMGEKSETKLPIDKRDIITDQGKRLMNIEMYFSNLFNEHSTLRHDLDMLQQQLDSIVLETEYLKKREERNIGPRYPFNAALSEMQKRLEILEKKCKHLKKVEEKLALLEKICEKFTEFETVQNFAQELSEAKIDKKEMRSVEDSESESDDQNVQSWGQYGVSKSDIAEAVHELMSKVIMQEERLHQAIRTLSCELKGKIDRRELNKTVARTDNHLKALADRMKQVHLIATGGTTMAAGLKMPIARCISCDRPVSTNPQVLKSHPPNFRTHSKLTLQPPSTDKYTIHRSEGGFARSAGGAHTILDKEVRTMKFPKLNGMNNKEWEDVLLEGIDGKCFRGKVEKLPTVSELQDFK